MVKPTIDDVKTRIERLNAEINGNCNLYEHNCPECPFEGRCGDEIDALLQQLKNAYCETAEHDCSKCSYVETCEAVEAKREIARQEHQKQLDTCKANDGNCSICEYLRLHCTFPKGIQAWNQQTSACCAKQDGCVECLAFYVCSKPKCQEAMTRYYEAEALYDEFNATEDE